MPPDFCREVRAVWDDATNGWFLFGGLYDFAGEVADDIQNFGTWPTYTVGNLAKVGNMASGEDAKMLIASCVLASSTSARTPYYD